MQNRIQEVLDKTGLNWTVREEQLVTTSGIAVPDKKAIIREDENIVLAIHGENYSPYQNHQLIELLDKVSQQIGLPIHSGGMFGDGKKVFIQLKSNDLKLGDDRIEGYITGVNSFDGTTSLAFGPSNRTISCQNTFFSVFRDLESKVRHTKNMSLKIDDICRGLEKVVVEEAKMFEEIKRMSETGFTQKERDLALRILFNISDKVNIHNPDELSTTSKNRINRFEVDLNDQLKDKGENLWGLFSGVTKYTTHTLNKGDSAETKMFGLYGNRERELYNELVELV